MSKLAMGLVMGLFMVGCAQRELILRSEAVSMTAEHAGASKSLQVLGPVEEEWCAGDEPALASADKLYGLADQVIYKAQGAGERADFITDVTIYRNGGCAELSGRLAKAF